MILPDGTKTKALVPQLYVRQVPEGDFQASGALLAGNTVNLQIEEDLVNAGGHIEGGVVIAQAGRDLSNIGGLMQARSDLLAKAGRNVTISSPTHTFLFMGNDINQSSTRNVLHKVIQPRGFRSMGQRTCRFCRPRSEAHQLSVAGAAYPD